MNKLKQHLSNSKNKTIYTNVIGAFAIKGVALIISLLTTPAYMRFFNNDSALGVWFTMLSVLAWILYFDLGIGNGLRNKLSESIALKDDDTSKKLISSAYFSIGILILIFAAAFLAVAKFINWNVIFKIDDSVVGQKTMLITVCIVFLGILGQLFFKIISSVIYALQKSSINNVLALVTSIINLVFVLVARFDTVDQKIIALAVAYDVAVCLPLLAASLIIFLTRLKRLKPSPKYVTKVHVKQVLGLGGVFFYVQIIYMLIMATNEILISQFSASSDVVAYNVYHKVFTLAGTLFTLALTPIWSMVTKASAEKDINWIKKLYKRLMWLSLLGVAAELLMVPFTQFFVNIWLGSKTIRINYLYSLAFALLGSELILNTVISSIANGLGQLRRQVLAFTVGAIIKIPLAFLLVKATGSWIGVVIANVISLVLYCIIEPIALARFFKKAEREIGCNNCSVTPEEIIKEEIINK